MKAIKVASEIFLSDCHFPDCDPKAWDLTLQIIRSVQPELVWVGGDFLDFKSVSKFLTNPKHKLTLAKDINSGRKALWALREAAPNAQMMFRQGNHDRRLQTFLYSRAPELAGLEELSLPELLHFTKLDIRFAGGDDRTKIGELVHIHGDELPTGRVFPARAALAKAHCNLIFGHVHRFSVAYESSLDGRDHVAHSIGCLQSLRVDYDFHTTWTQGTALVNYSSSGLFQVTTLPYFKDKGKLYCFIYGRLYSA